MTRHHRSSHRALPVMGSVRYNALSFSYRTTTVGLTYCTGVYILVVAVVGANVALGEAVGKTVGATGVTTVSTSTGLGLICVYATPPTAPSTSATAAISPTDRCVNPGFGVILNHSLSLPLRIRKKGVIVKLCSLIC